MVRPSNSCFPLERQPEIDAWIAEQNARTAEVQDPDVPRKVLVDLYGDDPIAGMRAAAAARREGAS